MNVKEAFEAVVLTLAAPSAEVELLVAQGQALALEIDMAQVADEKGKTKSAAAAVTALRALTDDMIARGRVVERNPDEADWSAPTPVADLAAVRNAAESSKSDARPRSRGGRKAAS